MFTSSRGWGLQQPTQPSVSGNPSENPELFGIVQVAMKSKIRDQLDLLFSKARFGAYNAGTTRLVGFTDREVSCG